MRALLDGIDKDRAVCQDGGVAKEFEFLAVESHLVFLGEAELL
jgi:hypothetical protein